MNITVIGAGSSGIAVLRKLRGHELFLTESKPHLDRKTISLLEETERKIRAGGPHIQGDKGRGPCRGEPGCADGHTRNQGRAEKEHPRHIGSRAGFSFLKKPIIAVTGTNGKTTVTTLIAEMMKDAGFKDHSSGQHRSSADIGRRRQAGHGRGGDKQLPAGRNEALPAAGSALSSISPKTI